jgi:chromosome segregation ATPase
MAKYKKNADLEDENQRLRQEMEDLAHLLADAREVAAQKDKQLAQAKREERKLIVEVNRRDAALDEWREYFGQLTDDREVVQRQLDDVGEAFTTLFRAESEAREDLVKRDEEIRILREMLEKAFIGRVETEGSEVRVLPPET